ncbi:MAG: hypothetical protein O3C60_16495 [Planctomycetota bacterium]|nr:hypothetical protein [Planctomycetota bacterium]
MSIGHLQRGNLEKMSGLALPWLDLHRVDSLATWMYTVTLWLCVGWAAFLYQLRRHRIDDYRGRYRLWVWLAVLWGLASFDVVVGMHDTCRALANRYLAQGVLPEWASSGNLYMVIGLPLGIRLGREVWECRTARFTFAAAFVCYALALVPGFSEWILQQDLSVAVAGIVPALPLWGNWLVWTTCATFARHIRLEMEGRSRRRGASEEASENSESQPVKETTPDSKPAHLRLAPKKKEKPSVQPSGWWRYLRFWKRKVAVDRPNANPEDQSNPGSSGKRGSDEVRGPLRRQKLQADEKSSRQRSGAGTSEQENSTASRVAQETIRMRELDEDDSGDSADMLHLSKAERKKLRREQRKFRDAA